MMSSRVCQIRILLRFPFFLHLKEKMEIVTFCLYGQFVCFSLHITIMTNSLLKNLHEKIMCEKIKQHYVHCH